MQHLFGVESGKDQAHIDWVVREWSKTPTHVLQGITRMLQAPILPRSCLR